MSFFSDLEICLVAALAALGVVRIRVTKPQLRRRSIVGSMWLNVYALSLVVSN